MSEPTKARSAASALVFPTPHRAGVGNPFVIVQFPGGARFRVPWSVLDEVAFWSSAVEVTDAEA